jgi:hypothetical protein
MEEATAEVGEWLPPTMDKANTNNTNNLKFKVNNTWEQVEAPLPLTEVDIARRTQAQVEIKNTPIPKLKKKLKPASRCITSHIRKATRDTDKKAVIKRPHKQLIASQGGRKRPVVSWTSWRRK